MNGSVNAAWVVADIQPGAVRMALVRPAPLPRVSQVRTYACAGFATFTDVLMLFEREQQIRLMDCQIAVSVSGATQGESFQIARGKWTISRSGLAAFAGRRVHIVNDVAAVAWSFLAASPPPLAPLGDHGPPRFENEGRWAVIIADEGVGLALIDIAESARILECEAGHTGFAPRDALEDTLLSAMRTGGSHVSWEQILTLPVDSPVWDSPRLGLPLAERAALRARVLGSFVCDVALASGSWSGVCVIGRLGSQLKDATLREAFTRRVDARQRFHRLIGAMPRWSAPQSDSILSGLAAMLARREFDG